MHNIKLEVLEDTKMLNNDTKMELVRDNDLKVVPIKKYQVIIYGNFLIYSNALKFLIENHDKSYKVCINLFHTDDNIETDLQLFNIEVFFVILYADVNLTKKGYKRFENNVKKIHPNTKLIVCTEKFNIDFFELLRAEEIDGYFLLSDEEQDILQVIEDVKAEEKTTTNNVLIEYIKQKKQKIKTKIRVKK